MKKIQFTNVNRVKGNKVFMSRSMIIFYTTRQLSSNLVRGKLYPLKRVIGSLMESAALCL